MFNFFKKIKKKPIIKELINNHIKIDQEYYDKKTILYQKHYPLIKLYEQEFLTYLKDTKQNDIVLGLNLTDENEITIQTTSYANLGNIAIVGQMGSGKSVFCKFMINNLLLNSKNTVFGLTASFITEYDNFHKNNNYFNLKINDQSDWDKALELINQEYISREFTELSKPLFIVVDSYDRLDEYIKNSNTNSTIFNNIVMNGKTRKIYFIFVLGSYNHNALVLQQCTDVFLNSSNFFQNHFPKIQLSSKHSFLYLSSYGIIYSPWLKSYTEEDVSEINLSPSVLLNLESTVLKCLYKASKIEALFEKRQKLSFESTLDTDSANFLRNLCTTFYIEYLLEDQDLLPYLSEEMVTTVLNNIDNSKITLAKINSINKI